MNYTRIVGAFAAVGLLLCTTGCFRVSSETRTLRNVGLEFGTDGFGEEKVELGVGFFTVGLAKLGTSLVEMPPQIRSILVSLDGLECSVYEINGREQNFGEVLKRADAAMIERDCERVVGIIGGNELVAVYMPGGVQSHRKTSISIMVLTKRELICATVRGDLAPVMQMALATAEEHLPKKAELAGAY